MQKPDCPADPKAGLAGCDVVLSDAEFRVLQVLAENAGQSISIALGERFIFERRFIDLLTTR